MSKYITMPSELVARTEAGGKYAKFMNSLRGEIAKGSPDAKAAAAKIYNCKTLSVGDVQTSTVLSQMSSMYANDEYIGTRLMPIFAQGKRNVEYYKYDKRDRLAYPDDTMTERSRANELNENRSKSSVSLTGRALKEFVDQTVINNQDQVLNEMMDAQENVLDGLLFLQEKRIATVCCDSANYGGNTAAVSASERWNEGGNPLPYIKTAISSCWGGRGPARRVGWASTDVWNSLSVNPYVLDLLRVKSGMVARDQFAAFFELDDFLVGAARQDTANSGQTASYGRIWSNVFGVTRVALSPSKRNAVFGYTFTEKAPVQRMWFDPAAGEEGGWYTQASMADKSEVVAGDTPFLITAPIG
jgi:hypothetical protein